MHSARGRRICSVRGRAFQFSACAVLVIGALAILRYSGVGKTQHWTIAGLLGDTGGGANATNPLPFLFDAANEPTPEFACRHCVSKDPLQYDSKLLPSADGTQPAAANASDTALEAPFCCGVCQYEARHCSTMAPEGAVQELVAMYERDFGFNFASFTPAELFSRIQGRTLWFMGDSQTWHSYYAAECFLRDYAVDLVRRPPSANAAVAAALDPVKWPIPVPPMCIQLRNNTRVCNVRINNRAEVVGALTALLSSELRGRLPRDLLVLNFGLHYHGGSVGGQLAEDLRQLREFMLFYKAALPTVIWRDVPVQHFATPKGEYDPASLGQQCRPLQQDAKPTAPQEEPPRLHGGGYNNAMAPVIHQMRDEGHLHLLLTWDASAPLWNTHRPGECTHWCSPSAYHVWLFLLNRLMAKEGLGNAI